MCAYAIVSGKVWKACELRFVIQACCAVKIKIWMTEKGSDF